MKERMLRGELYIADDPELAKDFARAERLVALYNGTSQRERAQRRRLLEELLGFVGPDVEIRPPFRCEYGTPISIGARTFINFDCLMLDVAAITIGADCQIGTKVQLLAAGHPIEPEARRERLEFGAPITLGDNVWLGGGVVVCPGVNIGDDSVVGAGAVVTRDVPAGVVAVGSPAKVLRERAQPGT